MSKRVRMTKLQQLKVCMKKDECPYLSLRELGKWVRQEFKLSKAPAKPTILNALIAREQLSTMSADCLTKKARRPKQVLELGSRVAELVILSEQCNIAISGRVMIKFATKFAAELLIPEGRRRKYSRSGWLRHFVARYNFRFKRAHGEISSVDRGAASKRLDALRTFMQRNSYVLRSAPALKQDKACVTGVVATNVGGTEKLLLLFLGKSKTPQWIKEMPEEVDYCGMSKGWMAVPVYQQWLRKLNETMVIANRHILLLMDNTPTHIEQEEPLSNVRVFKLPPNTMAAIQSMDQGVIANLKHGVMNLKTDTAVDRLLDGFEDPYSVSLVGAIEWYQASWGSVSPEAIRNCWKHAGLFVDRLQLESLLNTSD